MFSRKKIRNFFNPIKISDYRKLLKPIRVVEKSLKELIKRTDLAYEYFHGYISASSQFDMHSFCTDVNVNNQRMLEEISHIRQVVKNNSMFDNDFKDAINNQQDTITFDVVKSIANRLLKELPLKYYNYEKTKENEFNKLFNSILKYYLFQVQELPETLKYNAEKESLITIIKLLEKIEREVLVYKKNYIYLIKFLEYEHNDILNTLEKDKELKEKLYNLFNAFHSEHSDHVWNKYGSILRLPHQGSTYPVPYNEVIVVVKRRIKYLKKIIDNITKHLDECNKYNHPIDKIDRSVGSHVADWYGPIKEEYNAMLQDFICIESFNNAYKKNDQHEMARVLAGIKWPNLVGYKLNIVGYAGILPTELNYNTWTSTYHQRLEPKYYARRLYTIIVKEGYRPSIRKPTSTLPFGICDFKNVFFFDDKNEFSQTRYSYGSNIAIISFNLHEYCILKKGPERYILTPNNIPPVFLSLYIRDREIAFSRDRGYIDDLIAELKRLNCPFKIDRW